MSGNAIKKVTIAKAYWEAEYCNFSIVLSIFFKKKLKTKQGINKDIKNERRKLNVPNS